MHSPIDADGSVSQNPHLVRSTSPAVSPLRMSSHVVKSPTVANTSPLTDGYEVDRTFQLTRTPRISRQRQRTVERWHSASLHTVSSEPSETVHLRFSHAWRR